MGFKIVPARLAYLDIEEIADYISQDSMESARKWVLGLWDVINNLAEMPKRFPYVPEAFPCRSCLYHSHRIIYRIDESSKTIYILRVYHSAREPLKEDDFT